MKYLGAFFVLTSVMFGQDTRDLKRSSVEQLQFRETNIMPILAMVMDKKLPYPEINNRVKKQDELIQRRFGSKKVHITLSGFYAPLSQRVSMASGIEADGSPAVVVRIPSIMDQYEPASFDCTFIREIMHERDHLTEMTKNATQVDLENEIHVHALTAEFVLVPLIGKYKKSCAQGDLMHYTAWINSGRNEKSPIWRNYIKQLYAPVLH